MLFYFTISLNIIYYLILIRKLHQAFPLINFITMRIISVNMGRYAVGKSKKLLLLILLLYEIFQCETLRVEILFRRRAEKTFYV